MNNEIQYRTNDALIFKGSIRRVKFLTIEGFPVIEYAQQEHRVMNKNDLRESHLVGRFVKINSWWETWEFVPFEDPKQENINENI